MNEAERFGRGLAQQWPPHEGRLLGELEHATAVASWADGVISGSNALMAGLKNVAPVASATSNTASTGAFR